MKSIAITLFVIIISTCFGVPSQKQTVDTELECDTLSCDLPVVVMGDVNQADDTNRLDMKLRLLDTMLKEKEKACVKKKPRTK